MFALVGFEMSNCWFSKKFLSEYYFTFKEMWQPGPGGGRGGAFRISSDRGDQMGATIKTQNNPKGFQITLKNPWTKN